MLRPSNASLMKGFAARKECAEGFMESWARTYSKASTDLNSPRCTCQRTGGDSREFISFLTLSTRVSLCSDNQLWARVCSKWACTPQPGCYSMLLFHSCKWQGKDQRVSLLGSHASNLIPNRYAEP